MSNPGPVYPPDPMRTVAGPIERTPVHDDKAAALHNPTRGTPDPDPVTQWIAEARNVAADPARHLSEFVDIKSALQHRLSRALDMIEAARKLVQWALSDEGHGSAYSIADDIEDALRKVVEK